MTRAKPLPRELVTRIRAVVAELESLQMDVMDYDAGAPLDLLQMAAVTVRRVIATPKERRAEVAEALANVESSNGVLHRAMTEALFAVAWSEQINYSAGGIKGAVGAFWRDIDKAAVKPAKTIAAKVTRRRK